MNIINRDVWNNIEKNAKNLDVNIEDVVSKEEFERCMEILRKDEVGEISISEEEEAYCMDVVNFEDNISDLYKYGG